MLIPMEVPPHKKWWMVAQLGFALTMAGIGGAQVPDFTEDFQGDTIDPGWSLVNPAGHQGRVVDGLYAIRGPRGNATGLRRSMGGQGDFSMEIRLKLEPFFLDNHGGTQADLKIRFEGPGAWFEVVLNSFKVIRATSSEIGGNLEAPVTLRGIKDGDDIGFQLTYDEDTSVMSVNYSAGNGPWQALASGSGVTPRALRYSEIQLFKFGSRQETLPCMKLNNYQVAGGSPEVISPWLKVMASEGACEMTWRSEPARLYAIEQSHDLIRWETVASQIPASPPVNTHRLEGFCEQRRSFFRIRESNSSNWPHGDYCAMLAQEIQGKKHAFLAGNVTYYIGGRYTSWDLQEHETLGLTHPFHHDLRGRGSGIVTDATTGQGHDFRGWEFYKDTKIAYGTVIVNGKSYPKPVPKKMFWRPDRVICEYVLDGVAIREDKFIALNDVACSIIKASEGIELQFEGHSYVSESHSVERTSTVRYDAAQNLIHVSEGGTVLTSPVQGVEVEGALIYDGMSTVISTSADFADYQSFRDNGGRQQYAFKVPCGPEGVTLCWAMHDTFTDARDRVNDVLQDPEGQLAAKTAYMDDLLTTQIPYFRCSDPDIVNIYYYLWAIYLMYYIDVGEGWEVYPHTQTAVNNFLGMHRFDANFQIKVGAWVRDKDYYANGNVLIWSALLPFARSGGRLPDNMGKSWFSPVWGTTTDHVIGAWDIYEHSGDPEFIREVYEPYFKPLFWNGISNHWGARFDAVKCLKKMANLTGNAADVARWHAIGEVDNLENWMNSEWERALPDYWGDTAPAIYPPGTMDRALYWTGMAYMRNSWFPEDWARRMTERWAVDSEEGFNGPIPPTLVAMQDFDHTFPSFASAPDLAYYSIIGMYERNVGSNANLMGLEHLKKYNLKWGIPVAPESYDDEWDIWGDQYSNFNAGKILIILNGIAGLDYSIPEGTFEVTDLMPEEWSFMELKVPVTLSGNTSWVDVRIDRADVGNGVIEKKIAIANNPLETLKIEPWLEERVLVDATAGDAAEAPRGRLSYSFRSSNEEEVIIRLQN